MATTFHLSDGRVAAMVGAIVFEILLPLGLAGLVRRRLGASWRVFGAGALIFLLFQVITRVPAVTLLGAVLADSLQGSPALQLLWGGGLALTAGLCEEGGRYLGYRWLLGKEEKTWRLAVMYGLGHGGLESMLLIAGSTLITLASLLSLAAVGLESIPPVQRVQVAQQLADLSATPDWTPLVGAWERIWVLASQVALSVIVLQVFRRGRWAWLALAIGLHALLDFAAPVAVPLLHLDPGTSTLLGEGLITLFGLAGLGIIWALRDPPAPAAGTGAPALPAPLPAGPPAPQRPEH